VLASCMAVTRSAGDSPLVAGVELTQRWLPANPSNGSTVTRSQTPILELETARLRARPQKRFRQTLFPPKDRNG